MAGKSAAEFLAPFLSKWGELATWTPEAGGAGASFTLLLTHAGSEVRFGLVTAEEPEIMFRAADCPDLTNGDAVSVGGVDYVVRDGGNFKDATARRFRVRRA